MLVAEGLRKRYRAREVVRDFGLSLQAGEVVGLLGPNGAGKTTCFYMIVGLVPADAGRITLDGKDVTDQPMYARAKLGVGYRADDTSLFLVADFGAGSGQLRGGHYCFAGRHCRQRTLAFQFAPLKQQAGRNAFLARHQRHRHAGLVGAAHQRSLLRGGPAPAALVFQNHLH